MTSATIKLFLPRGDAKSLRTAEISNWTGKAVAAPRTELWTSFLLVRNSTRPESIAAHARERIARGVLETGEGGGEDAGGTGKMTKSQEVSIVSPEYRQFIEDLKARVLSARLSASRAVNCDMILLYWDIGCGIVKKQQKLGWGDAVVEMVAADLRQAFPEIRGFSPANVWRMRQLSVLYSSEAVLAQVARELENHSHRRGEPSFAEQVLPKNKTVQTASEENLILAQAVRELVTAIPWGHHVLLLGRIKSPPELLYYLRATARFGWSRNVLLNQIKASAYERAVTLVELRDKIDSFLSPSSALA